MLHSLCIKHTALLILGQSGFSCYRHIFMIIIQRVKHVVEFKEELLVLLLLIIIIVVIMQYVEHVVEDKGEFPVKCKSVGLASC